jgi:hypothetical protein
MENAQFRAKKALPGSGGTSEYRIFPEDYFTFCNQAIYFGDVFIDEITGLEFAMEEKILPLYGYADYRSREIVHGNRLITGTFSINFKEASYLYSVLEHIKSGRGGTLATNQEWTKETIEDMYEKYLSGEPGFTTSDVFETVADYYERALWGGEQTTFGKYDFKKIIADRRATPFFEQGFTITVGYGDNHTAFAARTEGTYRDVYGDGYDPAKHPTMLPIEETVRTINNVHLYSVRQVTDMSGNPVQESYGFIAQDLDNFDDIM